MSLLISTTLCDNTSFLKRAAGRNATLDVPEPEPKVYAGYCFMKIKNQFYDLNPFNLIKPWKVAGKKDSIQFNFCSDIDTSCREKDALIADVKNCKRFAGKHDEEKTWTISTDKTKHTVLSVKFPPGDSCGAGKNYQTTIKLTCNPKANTPKITNLATFNEASCLNEIHLTSKYGKQFYSFLYHY